MPLTSLKTMYTDAHIASLLEVITEQRNRIKALEADIAQAREEEDPSSTTTSFLEPD